MEVFKRSFRDDKSFHFSLDNNSLSALNSVNFSYLSLLALGGRSLKTLIQWLHYLEPIIYI